MAKGVHSKRRKRNQSIKRKILDLNLWRPTLEATSKRLLKRTFGKGDDSLITSKRNAFRFPTDPEAEIPQAQAPKYIDRRTMYAPREFLIKEMGSKKKNIIKQQNEENLFNSLRAAEDRAEGRVRENDVIEIDNIGQYDPNMVKGEKKSKNSNKANHMDVDLDNNNSSNINSRRSKRKKKTKSYYLVNY